MNQQNRANRTVKNILKLFFLGGLFVAHLPTIIFSSQASDENVNLQEDCLICFESFVPEARIILHGDSRHWLCQGCLDQLLTQNCPMCRAPIQLGQGVRPGAFIVAQEQAVTNKIIACTAAIVVTAVAAAIIESATRYMYPPAIVAAEPSQGWMSWFTSWFVAQEQKQINVSEYMSVSAQLAQELTNIVTITKETKSQNGIFKPLLLQGKVGAGQKACAYMLAQRCAMQPAVISSDKIMQALTNDTILQEITQLFEWAERQVNGVVIYFEFVELLLAERPGMSAEAKQARTLILSKLHAKNILIMGSTNQPQALGVALLHGFHTINFA